MLTANINSRCWSLAKFDETLGSNSGNLRSLQMMEAAGWICMKARIGAVLGIWDSSLRIAFHDSPYRSTRRLDSYFLPITMLLWVSPRITCFSIARVNTAKKAFSVRLHTLFYLKSLLSNAMKFLNSDPESKHLRASLPEIDVILAARFYLPLNFSYSVESRKVLHAVEALRFFGSFFRFR